MQKLLQKIICKKDIQVNKVLIWIKSQNKYKKSFNLKHSIFVFFFYPTVHCKEYDARIICLQTHNGHYTYI